MATPTRKRSVLDTCSSSSSASKKRSSLSAKVDSVLESRSRRCADKSVLCPHCDSSLSSKTFRRHKALYFDSDEATWTKIGQRDEAVSPNTAAGEELEMPGSPLQVDTNVICSGSCDSIRHQESPSNHDLETDDSSDDVSTDDSETEVVWENEGAEEEFNNDFSNETGPDFPQQVKEGEEHADSLVSWLVLFLLRLQSKYYIPEIAMACLFKFLYALLVIVGTRSEFVKDMVKLFPKSLYCLQKDWQVDVDFNRFVVCRKCYSVYDKKSCMEKRGTEEVSKLCTYRDHCNSRKSCGAQLLKSVHLSGGKTKLYPFRVYCYRPLISSLQSLLKLPGFSKLCEHWRSKFQSNNSSLRDIYDGKIWADFQTLDGRPFLASPYNYALMLNVDWFQPYKHTQSSVGALYLTIMNLPYDQRFKRENVILLGIIPGPSEPPRDINQYLRPLVKELQELNSGVKMTVHGKHELQMVRCAIIGVPCDMPAGRKACGFLCHSALLGCTKCLKVFPGSVGNKDYSGFDRSNWKARTNEDHRGKINIIKEAKNKTERNKLESKFGCRYSVLLQLPYFDPTRMLIVDPMHNLFLGTAKRMKNIWMDDTQPLLSPAHMEVMQHRVNDMYVPSDVGRIPRKIETKFSGFTADQYKNWVILYSIPCLYGLLDKEHVECWRSFVLSCRLLCKRPISVSDVTLADLLFLKFCQCAERLYGKKAITPNMHMHLHLKDVLLDYGPVYGFWLFSYERYNGILEQQPTNNRSIEIQLMSRFIRDNNAYTIQPPLLYRDELQSLILLRPSLTGSLLMTTCADDASTFKGCLT